MYKKDTPYFIYNSNKHIISEKIKSPYNLLYFAKKYNYKDYISALVDEKLTNEDYMLNFPEGYNKIKNINPYRISKGDEHRQQKRTHMEFARDLVSNFIIEDIYIELFNHCNTVKCKINLDDEDRDIIPSGKVKHSSDLTFIYDDKTIINVELKNHFKNSKTFTLTEKQIEGYKLYGGILLIIRPLIDQYSIVDINNIQLKKSDYSNGFYFYPNYKQFSFTKECFQQIINEIYLMSK